MSLSLSLSLFFSLAFYLYLYLFASFPLAFTVSISLSLFIFLCLYFTFSFLLTRALYLALCFLVTVMSAFLSFSYLDKTLSTEFTVHLAHFCLFLFALLAAFVSLMAYIDESLLTQNYEAMDDYS